MTRLEEFERWQREVHDPAEAAAGPREVRSGDGDIASWNVAPIPSGWAFCYSVWKSDGTGGSASWHAAPTREEALEKAIANVIRILSFNNEDSKLLALIPSPSQGTLL